MAALSWQGSDGTPRTFKLRDGTVLGRGADCDLVLEDSSASRRHAEIRKVGSTYVLRDLASKNGTSVNDAVVSTWTLKEGDVISIGNAKFVFRS